jgi:hypothetical protein
MDSKSAASPIPYMTVKMTFCSQMFMIKTMTVTVKKKKKIMARSKVSMRTLE